MNTRPSREITKTKRCRAPRTRSLALHHLIGPSHHPVRTQARRLCQRAPLRLDPWAGRLVVQGRRGPLVRSRRCLRLPWSYWRTPHISCRPAHRWRCSKVRRLGQDGARGGHEVRRGAGGGWTALARPPPPASLRPRSGATVGHGAWSSARRPRSTSWSGTTPGLATGPSSKSWACSRCSGRRGDRRVERARGAECGPAGRARPEREPRKRVRGGKRPRRWSDSWAEHPPVAWPHSQQLAQEGAGGGRQGRGGLVPRPRGAQGWPAQPPGHGRCAGTTRRGVGRSEGATLRALPSLTGHVKRLKRSKRLILVYKYDDVNAS